MKEKFSEAFKTSTHFHQGPRSASDNSWLVVMNFERQVKKLEFNVDLNNSFFVRGDGIYSLTETPDDKLVVSLWCSKQLLVLQDWEVLQTVDHYISVAKHLLLPGFRWELFPYMLINNEIINLKTSQRDTFIKGGKININSLTPNHFFVDKGNSRYELHFCATLENVTSSNREHAWFCLDLNQDFWQYLTNYGRLP